MDTPQNLMDKKESLFHKMMAASGISTLDQLKMHNSPVEPENKDL